MEDLVRRGKEELSEGNTYLLLQCTSITALHAAIHLSTNANRNRPMQVPTMAPVLDGTQP